METSEPPLNPPLAMYTGSIPHVGYDSEVRSLETVHRLRYFRFCNVLHIWTIRAIPTYRVYRLYDRVVAHRVCAALRPL